MADSTRIFARAFHRKNVDVTATFREGVERYSAERLADAAQDEALFSQVIADLHDDADASGSPFDAPAAEEPMAKQDEDDFTSRLLRVEPGARSGEADVEQEAEPAAETDPLDRETRVDEPAVGADPQAPADAPADAPTIRDVSPSGESAETPIDGTPAVVSGFDQVTPIDQTVAGEDGPERSTPIDHPPAATDVGVAGRSLPPLLPPSTEPSERDTPLQQPIVSRFTTDAETGIIDGSQKVEQFAPGPFAAGEGQVVAIASGLTGGLLPHGQQSVLVTSLRYGEGKTALAAGVALELARTPGQRVLLLDADLVRPSCAQFLGIEPRADLLDILAGNETAAEAIIHSVADNLSLIANPGMQGGASDLLGARAMLELLENLHQAFDLMVVDAPPLLMAADAYTLMPHLGGVLLAVRSVQSGLDELRNVRRSLDAARARLLGTVMTYAPEAM